MPAFRFLSVALWLTLGLVSTLLPRVVGARPQQIVLLELVLVDQLAEAVVRCGERPAEVTSSGWVWIVSSGESVLVPPTEVARICR